MSAFVSPWTPLLERSLRLPVAVPFLAKAREVSAVIQRSQLRQPGEFWHVSVSERQKLRVPLLRTVLPPEVGESARAMASTARQKRSYLHHQGEFQHQNCTVGTVHDSDHEGVVRIFVGHSYHSNELFILYYITRHFISYTRSVISVYRTLKHTLISVPWRRRARNCSHRYVISAILRI